MNFEKEALQTVLTDFRQFTTALYDRLRTGAAENATELALQKYSDPELFAYYAMMYFFQHRTGGDR